MIDEATRTQWLAEDRAKLAAEMQRPVTADTRNLEHIWRDWRDKDTRSEPRMAFMAARAQLPVAAA